MADRLLERQAHHRLDDDLVGQADAQAEPAAARRVHRQRLLCQRHRMARERRHDAGAELDAGDLPPGDGQCRQRVVARRSAAPSRS
jgi:hypothetical protein